MPRRANPFGPDETFFQYLPPDHPAAAPRMLTPLQEQVMPALMWLFDTQRNRAEGRSTVLAHVAIRLAIQGEVVHLDDVSELFTGQRTPGRRAHQFRDLVLSIAREHYRGHRFDWGERTNTLHYVGRNPR